MTTQSDSTVDLASSALLAINHLYQDIRDAVRSTTKTPAFLAGALLSIALGVGANTCIVSLFKATMLEKLLFRDPDHIVIVWTTPPAPAEAKEGVSVPDYVTLKGHSELFDRVGALQAGTVVFGVDEGGRHAEQLSGQRFTASLLEVLGVAPERGRPIMEIDDRIDEPTLTAMISDRLWQTRFGADPGLVGKTVLLDGTSTNIVGIMPPRFSLLDEESDYWLPMNFSSAQLRGTSRFLTVVAHLKPGVSFQQAQRQTGTLAAELARLDPVRNKGRGVQLEPLGSAYFGEARALLLVLQGAVGLILLLACANMAGLLLIRASFRQREVAIRCALGADRSRIVRQFLTESLMLSLVGGLLGVLLAAGGLRMMFANRPSWLLHVHGVSLDSSILAFAAVLSLLTGLAFGAGPARHIARSDMWNALKEATPTTTGSRRIQRVLVTAQIAFALILLASASLVLKSFVRLQSSDLGFEPKHLLSFQSRVPSSQNIKFMVTDKGVRLDVSPVPALLFNQVRQRLETVTGVESAAGINLPPLSGTGLRVSFEIEGRQGLNAQGGADPDAFNAKYYFVTPDFFRTMQMTIIQGREFTDRDTVNVPWGAVINETMAKSYWPNENPIGQQIRAKIVPEEDFREIIGIVRDIPVSRWDRTPTPTVYVSHLQQPNLSRPPYGGQRLQMTFLVRLSRDPQTMAPFVSSAVTEVNSDLSVARLQIVGEYLARQVDTPRYYMIFLGALGIVAMIIAAIGLYGVVAYSVARRAREIAIRVALGAQKSRVVALVMRESLMLIVLGVPLGIVGALILTRFVRTILWGVTATDPATFIGVPVVLLVVAVLATLIPARRALRLDPKEVLSSE